jgi:hypothetical protein
MGWQFAPQARHKPQRYPAQQTYPLHRLQKPGPQSHHQPPPLGKQPIQTINKPQGNPHLRPPPTFVPLQNLQAANVFTAFMRCHDHFP